MSQTNSRSSIEIFVTTRFIIPIQTVRPEGKYPLSVVHSGEVRQSAGADAVETGNPTAPFTSIDPSSRLGLFTGLTRTYFLVQAALWFRVEIETISQV